MALDPAIKDRVLSIWREELDLTPAQLSGVARNIDRESGWNPTEWGDNQTSRGLYQHHGPRLAALRQFAGDNYIDPIEQTRFAIHELKTTERPALAALKSSKTDAAAEKAFRVYFERPAGSGGSGGSGGSQFADMGRGGMMLALLGRPGGSDLASLLADAPQPRTMSEALSSPAAPFAAVPKEAPLEQVANSPSAAPPRISSASPPRQLRLSGLRRALRPPMRNLGGDYRRALSAILARRSANPFA